MSNDISKVMWPVAIKFDGDDELIYVVNQPEWENDSDLSHGRYSSSDQLIDSEGAIYHLQDEYGVVTLTQTGDLIELPEMTNLLRAHASQLGNCCVSKLGFYSISEAVIAVGSFSDNRNL